MSITTFHDFDKNDQLEKADLQREKQKQTQCSHPNRDFVRSSNDGADDQYSCPNCGKIWWVEYDG